MLEGTHDVKGVGRGLLAASAGCDVIPSLKGKEHIHPVKKKETSSLFEDGNKWFRIATNGEIKGMLDVMPHGRHVLVLGRGC